MAGDISLEQLNFEETDLNNLRKAIHGTQGLVLVTGPTRIWKNNNPLQYFKRSFKTSSKHFNCRRSC